MNREGSQKKKLTRKRLNNAFDQVYKQHPEWFSKEPKRLSFFDHIVLGHLDDVKEYLEDPDFNINQRDSRGNGCIWYSVLGKGGLDIVKFLVENGGDVNLMDNDGSIPIHNILRNGNFITKEQIKIFEYLLESGSYVIADPMAQGSISEHIDYLMNVFATESLQLDAQLVYAGAASNRAASIELQKEIQKRESLVLSLSELMDKVEDLELQYIVSLNFQDPTSKNDHYVYVDMRMSGAYLKNFLAYSIFKKPSMRLQLLYKQKQIQDNISLLNQQITNQSPIKLLPQLVTGFKAGGKRKTRRLRKD